MNSNDGTTAVQVSPIPTESEMASIRQIFTNVANALVRASELAKQVEDLEGRFKSLNEDHTKVMARNDELVTSLNEVRLQRDKAYAKGAVLDGELHSTKMSLQRIEESNLTQAGIISSLRTELEATKQAWDQACIEASNNYKRADELEANLAKVKSALGIVDPPKAEIAPQAEPIPAGAPTVESVSNPEPRPLTSDEHGTLDTESGTDFNRPYHWDATLNRWVND